MANELIFEYFFYSRGYITGFFFENKVVYQFDNCMYFCNVVFSLILLVRCDQSSGWFMWPPLFSLCSFTFIESFFFLYAIDNIIRITDNLMHSFIYRNEMNTINLMQITIPIQPLFSDRMYKNISALIYNIQSPYIDLYLFQTIF